MAKVTDLDEFRRSRAPASQFASQFASQLAGMTVWCCGCGCDEMVLAQDGRVFCSSCEALINTLEVFEHTDENRPK